MTTQIHAAVALGPNLPIEPQLVIRVILSHRTQAVALSIESQLTIHHAPMSEHFLVRCRLLQHTLIACECSSLGGIVIRLGQQPLPIGQGRPIKQRLKSLRMFVVQLHLRYRLDADVTKIDFVVVAQKPDVTALTQKPRMFEQNRRILNVVQIHILYHTPIEPHGHPSANHRHFLLVPFPDRPVGIQYARRRYVIYRTMKLHRL